MGIKEPLQGTNCSHEEWCRLHSQKAQQVREETDRLRETVRQELINCGIDPESREGKKLFRLKMRMIAQDASWLG